MYGIIFFQNKPQLSLKNALLPPIFFWNPSDLAKIYFFSYFSRVITPRSVRDGQNVCAGNKGGTVFNMAICPLWNEKTK